jgi:hypothetical protein
MGDSEIDRIMNTYYSGSLLFGLRFYFENLDNERDYITNHIITHYLKPFENCNTKFELLDPSVLVSRNFYHDELAVSVVVDNFDKKLALSLENPSSELAEFILNKFLPILNKCPLLEIISVRISINEKEDHQTYLLIETEQITSSKNRFNIYAYEPHGKVNRILSLFARYFGHILCNYLNEKNIHKAYRFRLYEHILCPIGLQTYGGENYCFEYSLIVILTTILTWHELFSRSVIAPIYKWGQCIEKFYWSVLSRKQLLYFAMSFRASLVLFLSKQTEQGAVIPFPDEKHNIDISDAMQKNFSKMYNFFLEQKEGMLLPRKLSPALTKQTVLTREERLEGKKDLVILLNRLKREDIDELFRRYLENSKVRHGIASIRTRIVQTAKGKKLQTILAIGKFTGPIFVSKNDVTQIDYNSMILWVKKNISNKHFFTTMR